MADKELRRHDQDRLIAILDAVGALLKAGPPNVNGFCLYCSADVQKGQPHNMPRCEWQHLQDAYELRLV